MTINIEAVAAAVAGLREALHERGWSERGTVYLGFAQPLGLIERYVKERQQVTSKRLDKRTLRDGLLIMRALDDHQLDGEILQLDAPDTERRFAVVLTLGATTEDNPRLEGSAGQLVSLLTIIGGSVSRAIQHTDTETLPQP